MDSHNERIKLLATVLGNLGVGSIIAGFVAPTGQGDVVRWTVGAIWLTVGFVFIIAAWRVLGRMR